MGIRLPCGHNHGVRLWELGRFIERIRVVGWDFGRRQCKGRSVCSHGRNEACQCIWPARHARQCLRMVQRLDRRLHGGGTNRSDRSRLGVVSRFAWWLVVQLRVSRVLRTATTSRRATVSTSGVFDLWVSEFLPSHPYDSASFTPGSASLNRRDAVLESVR